MSRVIAITGASGVIGRHLCDHFRRAGWDVRALMRDAGAAVFREPGIERMHIALPDTIDASAFRGADVVVHAAYATRGERSMDARRTNEEGTTRVIAAARAAGVRRFVFVSSLSARADSSSYYGRSKKLLEERLDPARDLVIRPGLVLASDGGLAQRLWRSIATMHVAPLIQGGPQIVQTVHVDDLCVAFQRALELDITGAVNVAEAEGISMREFIDALASASRTRYVQLPLPATFGLFTLVVLRAMEAMRVPLPITSDNLLGLLAMSRVETAADARRLGMRIRTARESIADLAPAFRASRSA